MLEHYRPLPIPHDRRGIGSVCGPPTTPQDPLWRKRNSRVELIMLNEYVDDFDKNREAPAAAKHDATTKHDTHTDPKPTRKPAPQ